MKTTRNLLLTIATLFAATFVASAQPAGLYPIFNGGTTVIPALSTNVVRPSLLVTNTYGLPGTSTNLILNVNQAEEVGFSFGFVGLAATTNAAVAIDVYRSYDFGVTYEATAGITFQNSPVAPGATTYFTNGVFLVPGVTTLAFVPRNLTIGLATNVYLSLNLKAPKVLSVPSTR